MRKFLLILLFLFFLALPVFSFDTSFSMNAPLELDEYNFFKVQVKCEEDQHFSVGDVVFYKAFLCYEDKCVEELSDSFVLTVPCPEHSSLLFSEFVPAFSDGVSIRKVKVVFFAKRFDDVDWVFEEHQDFVFLESVDANAFSLGSSFFGLPSVSETGDWFWTFFNSIPLWSFLIGGIILLVLGLALRMVSGGIGLLMVLFGVCAIFLAGYLFLQEFLAFL